MHKQVDNILKLVDNILKQIKRCQWTLKEMGEIWIGILWMVLGTQAEQSSIF